MKYPIPSRVPLPSFRPDAPMVPQQFPPAPMAPPQQQAQPGLGARFGGFIRNNSDALAAMSQGLLSGQTASEQWAGGMNGLTGSVSERRKKSKTLEWMMKNAPEYAEAVEAGALSLPDAYKMSLEAKRPQKQNFINAGGGQLYNADTNEWISAPGGTGGNEVYGTPIYGQNPETGETVLGVIGKDGSFKALDTGGVQITPGTTWQDFGNYRQGFGKGGQPVTPQIAVGGSPSPDQRPTQEGGLEPTPGSKLATERAGEDRTRLMAVETATQSAANVDRLIQSIKSDTALSRVLGPIDSRTPNVSPGAVRVQAKIDQIGGQAFMEARQMLKGQGPITDYESKRAEDAYIRLNQAQSEADFIAALDEFNEAVQSGVNKIRMFSGGGQQVGGPQGQGRTSSGITFTVEP